MLNEKFSVKWLGKDIGNIISSGDFNDLEGLRGDFLDDEVANLVEVASARVSFHGLNERDHGRVVLVGDCGGVLGKMKL